jgi:hypothetical protein
VNELPKKGMPSTANPTDSSKVYVFLVGKKNVSTYTSDILTVSMYFDSTWISAKDTRQRFAHSLGLQTTTSFRNILAPRGCTIMSM